MTNMYGPTTWGSFVLMSNTQCPSEPFPDPKKKPQQHDSHWPEQGIQPSKCIWTPLESSSEGLEHFHWWNRCHLRLVLQGNICFEQLSQDLRIDNLSFYFKLSDQLKVYYAQWRRSPDTKEALTRSAGIWKPLANVIHDPSRSATAPPILFQAAKLQVPQCWPRAIPCSLESWTLSWSTHSKSLSTFSAQAWPSASIPSFKMSNAPTITTCETIKRLAQKCVADSLAERQPMKKAWKCHTCMKHAKLTCSGSQTVKNCRNLC